MPKFISEEKFKEILNVLGIEYAGLTKSGEPRLKYNGKEFTIGRKKKFGNEEGYKLETITNLLKKISLEEARKRETSPGVVFHELKEKLRSIYSL